MLLLKVAVRRFSVSMRLLTLLSSSSSHPIGFRWLSFFYFHRRLSNRSRKKELEDRAIIKERVSDEEKKEQTLSLKACLVRKV